MRRVNSSIKVDFFSEKGLDNMGRTYFAYVPLEDMVCYAVAESYDNDTDINSAQLAVESVLVAFERNPSFRNIKQYIKYAHDQIVANSVKNKLEVAITVVVSDYTRIRYASCGNIKFYLMSDNAFYYKSATQTYYQFAANEYGQDKAPMLENRNLTQYLGQGRRLKPYISPKIELLEESTMLFASCSLWERLDDVEILDAYEESKPEEFLGTIQEMYLLTQLRNPAIRSYTLASLYVEKTFKEDTIKKKKRRRLIIIAVAVAIIIAIIASIVISIMRSNDRRAIAEIERLDSEGIRYSNYGNYSVAYEQYTKASELTGKFKSNLQYIRTKKALSGMIAERWHLFGSIITGDEHFESGDYEKARKAYQDAQNAYYDVYEAADIHSGLMVSEILAGKLTQVAKYITADSLIKIGELYEVEELYQEALKYYRDAEDIVKTLGDLELRKELITRIFETERKMNSSIEANFVRNVKALMEKAEGNLNYDLALQYCDFIINIYDDLGVPDSQSQEDKKRIERKIELDKNISEYTISASAAVLAERYEDAIRYNEMILELYREMDIGFEHERYRNIMEEIARIQGVMDSNMPVENDADIEDIL